MLRAIVVEEAYAVVARVEQAEFRSDRIAVGMRIEQGMRARGRSAELLDDEGIVSVRVPLGDASEVEFEEAAGDLMEASSW